MDKVDFLKSRGWYQWYNPDYWCHEQFASEGVDPTNRGLSTDDAYLFETDMDAKDIILKGMEIHFSAVNALSNMWYRRKTALNPKPEVKP